MLISEIIERLEDIRAEHGDVEGITAEGGVWAVDYIPENPNFPEGDICRVPKVIFANP